MNNTEYEYSSKVKSILEFIKYCEDNEYQLIEKHTQERIIFRNINKTMARITINMDKDGNTEKKLDFKEDILTDKILIERKESKAISFEDYDAVVSILNFLDYKEDNTLERIRYTYKKNNVIFEIDEYIKPEKSFVVAIEGEKNKVDLVYNEVKDLAL